MEISKELLVQYREFMMRTNARECYQEVIHMLKALGLKLQVVFIHRTSAVKGLDKDEKEKDGKYIRRERYAGTMSRSFYVGEGVEQEDIHARYENGILKLSIPKKSAREVEQKKYISIEG